MEANESLNENSSPTPKIWSTLLGGFFGGLLGFVIVNALHPVFPFEDLPELGMSPSAELVARYHVAEYAFRSNNASFDCGVLGGCLGLMLGLLTIKRRIVGALVGALLTASIGLLSGCIVGYVVGRYVAHGLLISSEQTLTQSALIHCAIWGIIGAGVGSAIGALHRPKNFINLLVAGIAGGVLGAILFNVAAPLVSPTSNLSIVTPVKLAERIFWIGPSTFLISLFVGLSLREVKPHTHKTTDVVSQSS